MNNGKSNGKSKNGAKDRLHDPLAFDEGCTVRSRALTWEETQEFEQFDRESFTQSVLARVFYS